MNRYALWSILGPIAWSGWALAIACVALAFRSRRALTIARVATGFAFVWALAVYVSPLGFALIEPLETRFPAPPLPPGISDVLVLTGGEHLYASQRHHRAEYGETGDRMVAGAMLARTLPAARLWSIGGISIGPGMPTDADWMASAWRGLGVSPRRIIAIGNTADTCGNARGAAALLPRGARLLLVTSAFHMPRAVACFRAAGLDVIAYPVDFVNGSAPEFGDTPSMNFSLNAWRTDVALHEYAGLVYYRLQGRIAELWPGPQPRMRR